MPPVISFPFPFAKNIMFWYSGLFIVWEPVADSNIYSFGYMNYFINIHYLLTEKLISKLFKLSMTNT